MPHALSLIQALLPGGARPHRAAALLGRSAGLASGSRSTSAIVPASASWRSRSSCCAATAVRAQASLEIDGRRAERLVAADGYQLSFAADGRTVPLPDPLTLLVADFVRALPLSGERATASRSREIAERMELLERIVTGFAQQVRGEAAP